MNDLEKKIDYTFKDKSLLKLALSHSSFSNEGKKHLESNERLEFLGDSVLSVIVADYLYHKYSSFPEGELTKIRASLVCEKALFEFSMQIDLGEYLYLGKGEEVTGGRERPSILADAFEALLAAVYLDGGMEAARKHIMRFIPENINIESAVRMHDYKTWLQEVIQQNREEKIDYVITGDSGPDHDKTFEVEVHLNSNVIGIGKGKSKKQAEQNAAREALELMGYETR